MSGARLAILVSGRGSNMAAIIEAARSGALDALPVLVLSDRAEAPALGRARAAGIEAQAIERRSFADRNGHEAALAAAIAESDADLVCLAGFMRVLSGAFVAAHEGRALNIHPSLLPAFPGLDTHARALAAGVRLHGASVHFVTAGVDEGPLIAQAAVPVLSGDTPDRLAARVLAQEGPLYVHALGLVLSGRVRWQDGRAEHRGGPDASEAALVSPLR